MTSSFTPAELSVLRLVAQGKTRRQVGTALFISENTVKTHLRNMSVRLHAHSAAQLVAIAMSRGDFQVTS